MLKVASLTISTLRLEIMMNCPLIPVFKFTEEKLKKQHEQLKF